MGDINKKKIFLNMSNKDWKMLVHWLIILTGDSYITSLDNSDSTNSNIDFNGYKLYVNGKEIKSN